MNENYSVPSLEDILADWPDCKCQRCKRRLDIELPPQQNGASPTWRSESAGVVRQNGWLHPRGLLVCPECLLEWTERGTAESELDYGPSPADFEGILTEEWSSGKVRFRGAFRKFCTRVGQHVAFWENGIVREISHWVDGYPTGTRATYYEDGERNEEVFYGEQGARHGNIVCRSFLDDKLNHVCRYENNELAQQFVTQESIDLSDKLGFDQMMKDAVEELMEDNLRIMDDLDSEDDL